MTDPDSQAEKLSEADFMRLFLRHEVVLRAYARTFLPDWSLVDDALQEASVTMWEKLDQLNDESGFLPWAKVIVRFKCLHLIDELRRRRPLLSDSVLQMIAEEAEATTISDFAQLRQALNECLAAFNESHRELMLAPYHAPGRVKEMARTAGKSPNSLYKLLGRLREKLATCVATKTRISGV